MTSYEEGLEEGIKIERKRVKNLIMNYKGNNEYDGSLYTLLHLVSIGIQPEKLIKENKYEDS